MQQNYSLRAFQAATSGFLTPDDMPQDGTDLVLTIKSIAPATFKDRKTGEEYQRQQLTFHETPKKFTLNATNLDTLIVLYGDQSANLVGKRVAFTSYAYQPGKFTLAIRNRVPVGNTTRVPQQPPAQGYNPPPPPPPPNFDEFGDSSFSPAPIPSIDWEALTKDINANARMTDKGLELDFKALQTPTQHFMTNWMNAYRKVKTLLKDRVSDPFLKANRFDWRVVKAEDVFKAVDRLNAFYALWMPIKDKTVDMFLMSNHDAKLQDSEEVPEFAPFIKAQIKRIYAISSLVELPGDETYDAIRETLILESSGVAKQAV